MICQYVSSLQEFIFHDLDIQASIAENGCMRKKPHIRIRLQGALTFLRKKNLHYHNQTPLGGGFYNVLVCFLLIPENIMIVKIECNSSLFCNMNH